MLEIFIYIAVVIALSLIGYISILHNNHKAKVEELEREIEARDIAANNLINELNKEVKNDNKSTPELQYKTLSWEESTTEWVKRHEDRCDVLGINYKGLNEEDPYIVIEYKLKEFLNEKN